MVEAAGNAAAYFVDRHLTEGRSAKTAFVEGSRTLSYGDLAAQSDCLADLFARHGIAREDRAAMIVHDVIEFPVIFWGSLKAGVVPVPLNTLLTADQYRYILADSRAKALFVSAPMLEQIAPLITDSDTLQAVFVVGHTPEGMLSFSDELQAASPKPMIAVSPDEVGFWLYSSGSTGEPKGVRHVHGSLRVSSDTYGAKVLGIQTEDTVYSAAKLFFAYGLGNGMSFPMSVGATTALLPGRPTPDAVFDVMSAVNPTIFCGVPTLYAAMLAAAGETMPAGCASLRRCISAGEALPEDIGHRWEALTGVEILDGVGSTEMLHIFLSNAPGEVVYGTSGTAVPGYEVRLVDEAGAPVSDDAVGELLVQGETAADGYWNQRHKSRTTFEGTWTRTGDKYTRRPDGRFVYCGRTDDMFKVSGQWLSPFEVEQALISHPSVLEAAVVAARDDAGLEKPKALVVLKDGASPGIAEELQAHARARLAPWKYPRWIEIRDVLPKTATGKIQRFRLRD